MSELATHGLRRMVIDDDVAEEVGTVPRSKRMAHVVDAVRLCRHRGVGMKVSSLALVREGSY